MPKIPRKKQTEQAPTVRFALGCNANQAVNGEKSPFTTKPDVRLAMGAAGSETCYKEGGAIANGLKAPDVRLAYWAMQGARPGIQDQIRGAGPNVRLAHGPGAQGDNVLIGQRGVAAMPDDKLPGLLVSFFYLEQFLKNRHRYHYRDWVMDSGAFSAHNSGAAIDLKAYMDCCKQLMATDPTLTEIYSLDVIGDWKGSLDNTEKMWAEGIPAIPCFHANEPWEALLHIAKNYPKIALGGVALAKTGKKMAWASQCFARVWPKKIHGFAFCSETAIMGLPFHSTDATNWEIGPCKFGQWKAFGNQRVSVRGSKQNLRAEVEWYLDLEARARVRWKKEMEKLEQDTPTTQLFSLTVRLAIESGSANGRRTDRVLEAPAVRLVAANDSGQGGARVIAHATGGEEQNNPAQQLIRKPRRK